MNVAALTNVVQRQTQHPLFPGLAIALLGVALIAGAWIFQFAGYKPCHLCLEQRVPWYLMIPVGFVLAGGQSFNAPRIAIIGLTAALVALALWSAYLGGFHAGVEYKWWPGPADCTGTGVALPTDGGLLENLSPDEIVRCDEVAWADPILGISLAGYNFLFSLLAAGIAVFGLRAALREKA
jgi:disulfide bond formation protein DsbB